MADAAPADDAQQYTADIEPLSACLRVFPRDARPGIDPYPFAATLVWIDRTTVEIKGLVMRDGQRLPIAARSAVFGRLAGMGATHVRMRRVRDGRERTVTLPIARYASE
jgi:hypothetical protein